MKKCDYQFVNSELQTVDGSDPQYVMNMRCVTCGNTISATDESDFRKQKRQKKCQKRIRNKS